ncbi:MAG: rhodanese-like domain-containing protein [Planctomycetota bacterium]|nr:rhodanese-like domain-containing protein [Planctomycetota bacterium]
MCNFNLLDRWNRQIFLFICIIFIFAASKIYAASQNEQKQSEVTSNKCKSYGSYCGVCCLYTVMKLAGQEEIDFREFIKPEYLGSRKGSSLAELKKAAEDNGMYAVPVGNLTSQVLRNCPYPIILHVKSDVASREYDHYELFLGAKNNQVKIFNPPEPVKLVAFAELAPRWDGNGLIVSAEPIDLGAIFAPARKRFAVYAVVAIAAILVVRLARRWLPVTLLNSQRKLLVLSASQGVAFIVIAFLSGMIYHFANDEGLLANENATASIQQAHLGNFIPKVSEMKVRKLLKTDTIFIDARLERDYKSSHLEGAINIPVNASDDEYQKIIADIAKNARLVLYCQSAVCRFAEMVAIKLISDGFSNVSIFRGGWSEWTAKNGKLEEKS